MIPTLLSTFRQSLLLQRSASRCRSPSPQRDVTRHPRFTFFLSSPLRSSPPSSRPLVTAFLCLHHPDASEECSIAVENVTQMLWPFLKGVRLSLGLSGRTRHRSRASLQCLDRRPVNGSRASLKSFHPTLLYVTHIRLYLVVMTQWGHKSVLVMSISRAVSSGRDVQDQLGA